MTTVVRRDFRSIPHRDASATWAAIVEMLTAGGDAAAKRTELMSVAGVACSVIADQGPRDSPIVVTCGGPRTRIYCCYDDDALDDSNSNESKLGFDALKGDWQVSLPVVEEDLAWVQAALKKHSSRIVARDKDTGIEVEKPAQAASNSLILDMEGFMKS
ncbi:hypothetical protein [Aromatoleum toluclasticum]|uniref:hypothetical protein n=1 Tax=Aromatoleum toluclasticum TaxID=92003 RepID=UPI000476D568|nr:hypothetical protein [Aromatoleum toluclasticum]